MIIDLRRAVAVGWLRQHVTNARAEAAAWKAEGIDPHLVALRRRDANIVERATRRFEERYPWIEPTLEWRDQNKPPK